MERYNYGGLDLWGWFYTDEDAIREFTKYLKTDLEYKHETWYVGRVVQTDKIILGEPQTVEVKILET